MKKNAVVDFLLRAVGEVIRTERGKRGFSQESFADAVGLHRTYIGSVERGERNITLGNLAKIALALGLTTSLLIAKAEEFPAVDVSNG